MYHSVFLNTIPLRAFSKLTSQSPPEKWNSSVSDLLYSGKYEWEGYMVQSLIISRWTGYFVGYQWKFAASLLTRLNLMGCNQGRVLFFSHHSFPSFRWIYPLITVLQTSDSPGHFHELKCQVWVSARFGSVFLTPTRCSLLPLTPDLGGLGTRNLWVKRRFVWPLETSTSPYSLPPLGW